VQRAVFVVCVAAVLGLGVGQAAAAKNCQRVVLSGEVKAGQEWKHAFGRGWIFRVLPVQAGKEGYTGWDLVVDRAEGAGYPDALLLATPPYRSVNEHEVGTTFGLRAQDAVGWNPRSFRFLTTPEALQQGKKLFAQLENAGPGATTTDQTAQRSQAIKGLMELEQHASIGEFRIVDARLAPGIADAAPFAESWAHAADRTAHTVGQPSSGKATAHGELQWMRFSVTLWLPGDWKGPLESRADLVFCPE